MLEWRPCPREYGSPGHELSSPGERERNTVMAIRVGVNMLQFCSVSSSLSHTTLSIKWEVYFSKELCHSSLLCRCYDSACIYKCVCIVVMAMQHLSLSLSLSLVLQYAVWTPNNKWLLIVYGEFLFLSCQHPSNFAPKDHRDRQKKFRMDCINPCLWIFQMQRGHRQDW